MIGAGVIVGLIPTISMLGTSLIAFRHYEASSLFEMGAQYLCAGLIVGAVAKELFPELGDLSDQDSFIGITIGFLLGCFFFEWMDYIVDSIESFREKLFSSITIGPDLPEDKMPILPSDEKDQNSQYQSFDDTSALADKETNTAPPNGDEDDHEDSSSDNSDERSILLLAKQAMASPRQRYHLRDELTRISDTLDHLEGKAKELAHRSRKSTMSSTFYPSNTSSGYATPASNPTPNHTSKRSGENGPSRNTLEMEKLAEEIDEEMHKLQYFIDHCRRLIHGSGAHINSVLPRIWITEQSTEHLQNQLSRMKEITAEVNEILFQRPHPLIVRGTADDQTIDIEIGDQIVQQELITEDNQIKQLSRNGLKVLYTRLDELEKELNALHGAVEDCTYKWGKRSRRSSIPIPEIGSTIPMSFLVPVTIDCIVDGFLLGITASINLHAGGILSIANGIEMGLLGLAVSIRIQKCTGSSIFSRLLALIVPPLIMFGTSLVSIYFGLLVKQHPLFYKLFISFGIIALLSLVINELLAEARDIAGKLEVLNESLPWWSGMIFFFGIYLVLVMDAFFPSS